MKTKKLWVIFAIIVLSILLGGIMVGPIMSKVESPPYEIVSSEENIEIRNYKSMIIAEVEVEGNRYVAMKKGFPILADYIFGNNSIKKELATKNSAKQQVSKKIEMMAPVVQQQTNKPIAMTAPVWQQSNNGLWKIHFVMPSQYSMDNLPKPNNSQVKIKLLPAKKYIVIRFSGMNSDASIANQEKQLLHYVAANQISIKNSPKYAFYNPPWTLPFMRRNEIMFEIQQLRSQ